MIVEAVLVAVYFHLDIQKRYIKKIYQFLSLKTLNPTFLKKIEEIELKNSSPESKNDENEEETTSNSKEDAEEPINTENKDQVTENGSE